MISIGSMKVKYSIPLLFASLLFSLPAYSSTTQIAHALKNKELQEEIKKLESELYSLRSGEIVIQSGEILISKSFKYENPDQLNKFIEELLIDSNNYSFYKLKSKEKLIKKFFLLGKIILKV